MLTKIIVGFDGSKQALVAFRYAMTLGDVFSTPVEAMTALEPQIFIPSASVALPVMDPYAALPTPVDAEDHEQRVLAAQKALDGLFTQVTEPATELSSRIVDGGLVETLTRVAGPDHLIAVGMHGRFASAGVGSSTRALLRHGKCPVLIAVGAWRPVTRLVAVHDGSGPSARAIEWARNTCRQGAWKLTVLAVVKSGASIDSAMATARTMAPEAEVMHFEPGSEADQIEAAAGHSRDSIIVMGAYPDSLFHQFFFGGTTGHVLRHVDAPVLLVP